jgi:hypothetical protein
MKKKIVSWDLQWQLLLIEEAENDTIIRNRLKELGYIKKPIVDYAKTDSPDSRDAYTVRINGHSVGIYSQEQSAKNHTDNLIRYIGG